MKRTLFISLLTVALAGIFAVSAFAMTKDEIVSDYKNMFVTDWSPDGNSITFGSDGDIYTVDITNGEVTNLTKGNEFICGNPVFSPDGSKIYFSQSGKKKIFDPEYTEGINIAVLDLATGESEIIIPGGYSCNVSPDGTMLVYTKDYECHAIMNLETGEERVYRSEDMGLVFAYGFSCFTPDNEYFVTSYLAYEPGSYVQRNDASKLYKINVATGEAEEFTLGSFPPWNPRFSPDGNTLLFSQLDYTANRTEPIYPCYQLDEDGNLIVDDGKDVFFEYYFVKNEETGEFENLTYDNYYAIEGEQTVYQKGENGYSISPEEFSKTITVPYLRYNVASCDLATGKIKTYVNPGNFQTRHASWSPDGTKICYVLWTDGDYRSLFIYDLEFDAHKLVINGVSGDTNPTVVEVDDVPAPFAIAGNYPNPFNPTTTIQFTLEKAGAVNLDIYNVSGQKIRTLTTSNYAPGSHELVWNGHDDNGIAVSSGVYICRLKMNGMTQAHPMLLAK